MAGNDNDPVDMTKAVPFQAIRDGYMQMPEVSQPKVQPVQSSADNDPIDMSKATAIPSAYDRGVSKIEGVLKGTGKLLDLGINAVKGISGMFPETKGAVEGSLKGAGAPNTEAPASDPWRCRRR